MLSRVLKTILEMLCEEENVNEPYESAIFSGVGSFSVEMSSSARISNMSERTCRDNSVSQGEKTILSTPQQRTDLGDDLSQVTARDAIKNASLMRTFRY